MAALVPAIEAAAGRQFEVLPEVTPADAGTFARVVFTEQLHLLGRSRHLSSAQVEARALRTASTVQHAVFGKYGFLDKRIYIDLEGIYATGIEHHLDTETVNGIVDVVLVHELVHALQDEHLDLGELVRGRAGDEVHALVCTIEGHAAWVQQEVALSLGLEDAATFVAVLLGYDRSTPSLDHRPETYQAAYVYGQGSAYVDAVTQSEGIEGMWRVLADPPRSTSSIVHPGRASAEPFPRAIRRGLKAARNHLAPRHWARVDEPLGDFDIRHRLLDARRDSTAADMLRRAWTAEAFAPAMLGVDVQLIEFFDSTVARTFVQERIELALATLQVAAVEPHVSGSAGPIDLEGTTIAGHEQLTFSFPGTPAQEMSTLFAARGPFVVQVESVNAGLSSREQRRAALRVLRMLEGR